MYIYIYIADSLIDPAFRKIDCASSIGCFCLASPVVGFLL